MIKDLSKLPVKITIKNTTNDTLKMELRDCVQTSLILKPEEEASVLAQSSDSAIYVQKQALDLGIECSIEEKQEEPETTKVVASEEELKEALANIEEGETIKIASDLTVSEAINLDKPVTLSITDGTLNLSDKQIVVSNDVTIKGKGTIYSDNSSGGIEVNNGKLTIEDTTIETPVQYGVIMFNEGELNLQNAKINSKVSSIATNNTKTSNANIVIDGKDTVLTASEGPVIYMPAQGTVTVKDGTLNGGISARMGTVNVLGGTINSQEVADDKIEDYYNKSLNVYLGDAIMCMAGTYTEKDRGSNDLTINLEGGTINGKAEGHSAVTIYNLGKVKQDIALTIKENATLTVKDETKSLYEIIPATEIVPSDAKDYKSYTKYENAVTLTVED